MYLTYIDDSDTRDKRHKWQVLGAVLIPDGWFFPLELVASDVIRRLMSEDRYEEFTEFHACELYGGYGMFKDIDQSKRFAAIEEMLGVLPAFKAKVAYGAVNLDHLKSQPYASANPLDITFRMCVEGIGSFFHQNIEKVLAGKDPQGEAAAILIADDFDKGTKAILQKSFRSMRGRYRSASERSGIELIHDDMYFGDSRYSIGIQVADLCSYFIARYLAGDEKIEHYYNKIEPLIISARQDS